MKKIIVVLALLFGSLFIVFRERCACDSKDGCECSQKKKDDCSCTGK